MKENKSKRNKEEKSKEKIILLKYFIRAGKKNSFELIHLNFS